MDAAVPVNTAAGRVGSTDQHQQALVLDCAIRQRTFDPLAETAGRDFQQPTDQPHRVLVPMLLDEAVLHSGF